MKQPLYAAEEPGTDHLLLLQHLGIWSGPGQSLRFKNDPNVGSIEDAPGPGPPGLRDDAAPRLRPQRLPLRHEQRPGRSAHHKQDRIVALHDRPQRRRTTSTPSPSWSSWNGTPTATTAATSPSAPTATSTTPPATAPPTPTPTTAARIPIILNVQDDPHRRGPSRRRQALFDSQRQPLPQTRPAFSPKPGRTAFRNPWRIAFDRKTGALWVGQNGQDLWEQVYLVHKGENYGWSRYEGSHPFQPLRKAAPTPITFPIVEHPHSEMRSLTGGVVYRGSKFPDLDGAFIYGDWSTGRIWGVKSDDHQDVTWHQELARTPLQITGFRETPTGDILVIDHGGAASTNLLAQCQEPRLPASQFPRKLSETGLFVSTADNAPGPRPDPLRRERAALVRRGGPRSGSSPSPATARSMSDLARAGTSPKARCW